MGDNRGVLTKVGLCDMGNNRGKAKVGLCDMGDNRG